MANEQDDDLLYRVVVNQEEQYSIWPVTQEVPAGWTVVGDQGNKERCLSYINTHWTDMRPLSLRRQMASADERQDG
jgi:MbtH protein